MRPSGLGERKITAPRRAVKPLASASHGQAQEAPYSRPAAPPRGAPLARVARNAGTDFVFQKADNDLVVPTNGVFQVDGAVGFPIVDPLVFAAEAGVDHSSYFTRPEVSAKLLEWLPG